MVMMLFIDGLRNIPVIEMILVSYLMRLSAVLCKAYAMLKIYDACMKPSLISSQNRT